MNEVNDIIVVIDKKLYIRHFSEGVESRVYISLDRKNILKVFDFLSEKENDDIIKLIDLIEEKSEELTALIEQLSEQGIYVNLALPTGSLYYGETLQAVRMDYFNNCMTLDSLLDSDLKLTIKLLADVMRIYHELQKLGINITDPNFENVLLNIVDGKIYVNIIDIISVYTHEIDEFQRIEKYNYLLNYVVSNMILSLERTKRLPFEIVNDPSKDSAITRITTYIIEKYNQSHTPIKTRTYQSEDKKKEMYEINYEDLSNIFSFIVEECFEQSDGYNIMPLNTDFIEKILEMNDNYRRC